MLEYGGIAPVPLASIVVCTQDCGGRAPCLCTCPMLVKVVAEHLCGYSFADGLVQESHMQKKTNRGRGIFSACLGGPAPWHIIVAA